MPTTDKRDDPATGMTIPEILRLPAAVSLPVAARVFGMHKQTAYVQVREGTFPVKVRKVGREYRVYLSDILTELGIEQRAAS